MPNCKCFFCVGYFVASTMPHKLTTRLTGRMAAQHSIVSARNSSVPAGGSHSSVVIGKHHAVGASARVPAPIVGGHAGMRDARQRK